MMSDDVPNADKDDIMWSELRRGFDRIIALLDATDAAVARAGRELTEDELYALWCEHWR